MKAATILTNSSDHRYCIMLLICGVKSVPVTTKSHLCDGRERNWSSKPTSWNSVWLIRI